MLKYNEYGDGGWSGGVLEWKNRGEDQRAGLLPRISSSLFVAAMKEFWGEYVVVVFKKVAPSNEAVVAASGTDGWYG